MVTQETAILTYKEVVDKVVPSFCCDAPLGGEWVMWEQSHRFEEHHDLTVSPSSESRASECPRHDYEGRLLVEVVTLGNDTCHVQLTQQDYFGRRTEEERPGLGAAPNPPLIRDTCGRGVLFREDGDDLEKTSGSLAHGSGGTA